MQARDTKAFNKNNKNTDSNAVVSWLPKPGVKIWKTTPHAACSKHNCPPSNTFAGAIREKQWINPIHTHARAHTHAHAHTHTHTHTHTRAHTHAHTHIHTRTKYIKTNHTADVHAQCREADTRARAQGGKNKGRQPLPNAITSGSQMPGPADGERRTCWSQTGSSCCLCCHGRCCCATTHPLQPLPSSPPWLCCCCWWWWW